LDDMGVSKLSAKAFFLKVNYSFKTFFKPSKELNDSNPETTLDRLTQTWL